MTIRKDRLLQLAEFLEKLPPERFAYNAWVGQDWKGAPDLSCGTTACALGWATIAVPEAKLRLVREGKGGFVAAEGLVPSFEDSYQDSIDAARHAFGLTSNDAVFLFSPEHWDNDLGEESPAENASAREVAAHIRRFVEARA